MSRVGVVVTLKLHGVFDMLLWPGQHPRMRHGGMEMHKTKDHHTLSLLHFVTWVIAHYIPSLFLFDLMKA